MKKLEYTIEDRTITELLGVQNFSTKESAILELVKNSYDAKAKKVIIKISLEDNKKVLEITDNGQGMSTDDILNNWMHVGKSSRKNLYEFDDGLRVYSGSKGIGRFAIARLGENSYVTSITNNSDIVFWESDCENSYYDNDTSSDSIKNGTHIKICNLRDSWGETQVKKLTDYLGLVYNSKQMKIEVYYLDKTYSVTHKFSNKKIGVNFTNSFEVKYDAKNRTISGSINSDEFNEDIKSKVPIYRKTKPFEVNIEDELKGKESEFEEEGVTLKDMLQNLGDFDFKMYFRLSSISSDDYERFKYKHKKLEDSIKRGVVLYRNAFSISSYEGLKDWLDIGSRARKSPAAATHETGRWRVRYNQISGYINIDKVNNDSLKEMSNRQGIEEDNYWKLFKEIIYSALNTFERYRQNIILEIVKQYHSKKEDNSINTYLKSVMESPEKINDLSEKERVKLVEEIQSVIDEKKEDKKQHAEREERFKYDSRILNVLATTGLKASAIAHQIKNQENHIVSYYDQIVNSLKEYGYWNDLNSSDKSKYASRNIPSLLLTTKEITDKYGTFMDVMLEDINKSNFEQGDVSIFPVLKTRIIDWQLDYGKLKIELINETDLDYKLSKDIINVIIDNLVLNSVQQNENKPVINAKIKIEPENSHLLIHYEDDGVGLPKKYINNPRKILEVHESSRKDGHGLGMWIVHNSILNTGGEIISIDGHSGFKIDFTLGVKNG